jgi:hypothetical protein
VSYETEYFERVTRRCRKPASPMEPTAVHPGEYAFEAEPISLDGDSKMDTASQSISDARGHAPESLRTLSAYLELSLECGKSVVMMRRDADTCSICIGDPADEEGRLKQRGTISKALADELLALTQAGLNRMTVGDQTYRFFRSFTLVAGVGAVVFAPT